MMSIQGPLWTWRKMEFRRKRGTAELRLKRGEGWESKTLSQGGTWGQSRHTERCWGKCFRLRGLAYALKGKRGCHWKIVSKGACIRLHSSLKYIGPSPNSWYLGM